MTEISNTKLLSRNAYIFKLGLLVCAWFACLCVCSLFGPAGIDVDIIFQLRLPMLLAASLVGAGLSVGGFALQGILRNPLAEPYLLGISSGAGVGVILSFAFASSAIIANLGTLGTSGFAFAGAALTSALVYWLSRSGGRVDRLSMVLAGVIINSINGAIMLLVYLYLDQQQIANFASWMMGSVRETFAPGQLVASGVIVLLSAGLLVYRSAQFNVLGLGASVAQSAGIAVNRLRVETFICVAISAAVAVSLAGPIGFVGLIVPHITRQIFKHDSRLGMIGAFFLGGIFMLIAQTLCYAILPDVLYAGKVPVGVVTALAGGPFFLILLRRSQGKSYA